MRFNIKGSCLGDFFTALCCPCCVLVQNEKEIDERSKEIAAFGATGLGYQQTTGMIYHPQNNGDDPS